MLCYAMLCCAVLCCAVLCCAELCCAMLCYAVLCYAMLCYAILCKIYHVYWREIEKTNLKYIYGFFHFIICVLADIGSICTQMK